MPLSDVFEKLGRAIFESPFSAPRISEDVPELAEIRLAAIEAIKARSHRAGGKMVFPFNVVRIHLSGVADKQAEIFHSDFMAKYFDRELRAALARSNYLHPEELRVEIETTAEAAGQKQDWICVDTALEAEAIEPAPQPSPEGVLIILQGAADQAEISLAKVRTNIGRVLDVFTNAGPSRRNDVTFSQDTDVNRSVSREHAHILRDSKSGEYRIFNDRWYKMGPDAEANCGLWIVRDGLSQPVHRNSRGSALRSGDELHFGRAVVRFEIPEIH